MATQRKHPDTEGRSFPPEVDGPLIDAPEYLISFLQRLNRDQMESALRTTGLKLASWRVLSCLEERGPMSLLDLAELSVTERTVLSRLVDRLCAEGLVAKDALPHDKRISMVTVTTRGREALKRSMQRIHQLRAHLYEGFSATDYETLRDLLSRLKRNAQTLV